MQPIIEIEGRKVGAGQPVLVIAEAADSHLGSMAVAREMIEKARLTGADCIKFQHHLPEAEMLPDIPMSDNFSEPLYEFLRKNALNIDQHRELKAYCEKIGIIYLCTPFSYQAAVELNKIGVKAFKIGSGEFSDHTSLEKIAELGKPMILSSGMSTAEEIQETYAFMKRRNVPFAFTYCVSEYPPAYEDINLGYLRIMQEKYFDIVIGHSDHTPDLYTCFAAVALGAKIIEKHITLDKKRPGPDQSVSIDMQDLARLVEGVRKIEKAMGNERFVHEREKQIRSWAFRSIVTTQEIPGGTILTREMLWTKRPGTGIPSKELPSVIGKKTKKAIKANTLLRREDIA
jgi:sialic acid synthase SpsE